MEQVNFSISEILEIYNTIPRILSNKVTKVNLESYHGSSKEKLFIEVTNGSYWIIKIEEGKEWLLPSNKLTLNQHNKKSIQSFFEFQSYDKSENKDFILVQAATVSLLPNASRKEWKLEKLGTLNFDPNYSTNKLRSQLKQIENQRDQYQSELEEIKQEKEQLTAQVAQLASSYLKDIRDSLVTKDELNQQIKMLTEQSTQSSSNKTEENQSVSWPKTEFKELQKSQRKNTGRIYNIEQNLEKNKQSKDYIDNLHRKQDETIDTVNKLEDKIRKYEEEREKSKSELSMLKNKLATLEEERSQTHEQLNIVPELLIKLEKLEKYLRAKQDLSKPSNTPKSSSSKQENIVEKKTTIPDRMLSLDEYKLVYQYNNKQETFSNSISVSQTQQSLETRRLGKSETVILEEFRRGNFWIVEIEGITYLIPSNSLRVNQYNVKNVEAVFECRGYQPKISSHFKLLQPAIVKKTKEGNNWQLEHRGILQF